MVAYASHPEIRIHTFTELDCPLESSLLALYGSVGLTDQYWQQVQRVFVDKPPGLLTLATSCEWPPQRLAAGTVQAALVAAPADKTTGLLSAMVVAPGSEVDFGVQAAVFQGALRKLQGFGIERIRYRIGDDVPFARRRLTDLGFLPDGPDNGGDEIWMQAPVDGVLGRLGLDQADVSDLLDPGFGSNPAFDPVIEFLLLERLGGPRRPPGVISSPDLRILPDGGVPEPGVPSPEPTPGPDG